MALDFDYGNKSEKRQQKYENTYQGFCNKYLILYKFHYIVIERQIDHFNLILDTIFIQFDYVT